LIASQSMEERRQELGVCQKLIERHVGEFTEWFAKPHPMGNPGGLPLRNNGGVSVPGGAAPGGTAPQSV
jgi:hypothetical protein